MIAEGIMMPRGSGAERKKIESDAPAVGTLEMIAYGHSQSGIGGILINDDRRPGIGWRDLHAPAFESAEPGAVKGRDVMLPGREPAQFKPRDTAGVACAIKKVFAELSASGSRGQTVRAGSVAIVVETDGGSEQSPVAAGGGRQPRRYESDAIDCCDRAGAVQADPVRVDIGGGNSAVGIRGPALRGPVPPGNHGRTLHVQPRVPMHKTTLPSRPASIIETNRGPAIPGFLPTLTVPPFRIKGRGTHGHRTWRQRKIHGPGRAAGFLTECP